MESNYLNVSDYEGRIFDSKSSKHKDFIEFQHLNGKYYFAWIVKGKVFLRSEGYIASSERDIIIIQAIKLRQDKNNYCTESEKGVHFLVLLSENNKEIARSYPMREEIDTFLALNYLNIEEDGSTDEINTYQNIKSESVEETTTQGEVSDQEDTAEINENIVPEISSNLIQSPLLESFENNMKATNETKVSKEVDKTNQDENNLEETLIPIEETRANENLSLDYFDEDKDPTLSEISEDIEIKDNEPEEKTEELEIKTKLSSILVEEEKNSSKFNWKWLIWLFFISLIGCLLWWLFKMDGYNQVKKYIPVKKVAIDTLSVSSQKKIKPDSTLIDQASIQAKATWEKTLGGLVAIRLPDGSIINVPENGTEKKLVEYLEAKCGTSEIKKTWFDMDRILFKSGTDELKGISDTQIVLIAKIFKSYPKKKFKIGGYTDNVGDQEANIRLSAIRAAAATRAIASKGIDSARMRYEGYGQEHPICPANDTEECRAKNRRIAIRVDFCE
jgi:outer membrane protein OmpA-like peptidoglycan-associated protein